MQPITHPALSGTRHGFFTREGGVSEGVYASLNCGPGSEDVPEKVAENRARCARSFGLEPEALLTCYQIHSADVQCVSGPFGAERPKADAMVTAAPGLMLGILTADCAPVLFADAKAGVIGAAHAGWKGAFGGVLENTVNAMEELGARRAHISAVIGPCIQPASYEVGDEFVDHFRKNEAHWMRYFIPPPMGTGTKKWKFDLPGFARARLEASGITKVASLGMDTLTDEGRFFSYRRKTLRAEPDYARQLSAIAL